MPPRVSFQGKTESLKGHIYVGGHSKYAADKFLSTTKEISEYIGREFHEGQTVKDAVRNVRAPNLPKPVAPVEPDDDADAVSDISSVSSA